jgi:signal transduction histidine kinase
VIENIIDNGLKYSGDTPVLKVTGQAAGGFVVLTFTDRGKGIPREDIDHVFERFYRGRNVTSAGSGLGLTIAKRILEFHGGDIRLRSDGVTGTEVSLFLPVATP